MHENVQLRSQIIPMDRDIIRVVTPGTVIASSMLEDSKNNYICAIYIS